MSRYDGTEVQGIIFSATSDLMTRANNMFQDIWLEVTNDPPSNPLDAHNQKVFAAECAGESCLPESDFSAQDSADPRWSKFWDKADGTPEGDKKAYDNAFI